jgi:hypothetical protein
MVRIFRAPAPPVRPLMSDFIFDTLHEGLIGILVHLSDLLVGEDEPVVPCPGKGSRALRGLLYPLLVRQKGEEPAVRRHLLLLSYTGGILPDLCSPDGHAGIDLSPELLQIIKLHNRHPTPTSQLLFEDGG